MKNIKQLKKWAADLFDWAMEEESAIEYRSKLGNLICAFTETLSGYKSKGPIRALQSNLADVLDLYARHVDSVHGEYCDKWYARGSRIKSRRDAKQRALELEIEAGIASDSSGVKE